MTEKENLLRMYRGELPAYLPDRGFQHVKCSHFVDVKAPGYHVDEFGVEYIGKDDVFGGAPVPYPGRYILDDITRWRDVIKAPDLSGVDWEACAKKDLADIDREQFGVVYYGGKIFQRLCDFMGFTEGLCAIAEEPEEVYALFDYLCAFNEEIFKNIVRWYKPEAICIADDTATARAPFISLNAYRTLVKPFHARIAAIALNEGVYVEKHDCGRSEAFVDDWVEFGVRSWNPAQPSNDLAGIKAKYGRSLIIQGGWDGQGSISQPTVSNEELTEALYRYVDTLAPDGGFVFSARVLGDKADPVVQQKSKLIRDFYENYARCWYDKH